MSDHSSESTLVLNDSSELETSLTNDFPSSDESDFLEDSESKQIRLKEKIATLQITLNTLKDQLKKEMLLYKDEIEEVKRLEEQRESTLDFCCNQCGFTSRELFEKQADVYQQGILKARALKKAKMQREIAITSYKTQLLQVENMCNLELTRVKQNKQTLQPLQMIASEWNKGDFVKPEVDNKHVRKKTSTMLIEESVNELKSELDQMLLEIGDKFASFQVDATKIKELVDMNESNKCDYKVL